MATASLKKLALRGAFWTIAGYGTSQILRFGNNWFLTQLLLPEYFGLMAFVNTLRIGVELFSDIGIPQSIIRHEDGDDPDFLDTAWTLQVIRGFILGLLFLILSIPIFWIYKDPRLQLLMPMIGLMPIISGFTSTKIHLLNRSMDLGRLTLYELTLQTVTMAMTLGWAVIMPNEWALAIGSVEAVLIGAVSSYWLVPGTKHRFLWKSEYVQELISFGRWIFVATALMYAAEQADRLILAKLFDFNWLGVYTIAFTLATLPKEVAKALSYNVIFPAISNQAELPRHELRLKILRQRGKLLLGFAVLLAVMVLGGDWLIDIYRAKYANAKGMLPILTLGGWFSVLFYTSSPALLALGKPLYSAQSNLARFITISLGMWLGYQWAGAYGVIVAIALSDVPLYLVNLYGLWKEKILCLTQDIWITLVFGFMVATLLGLRYAYNGSLPFHWIS